MSKLVKIISILFLLTNMAWGYEFILDVSIILAQNENKGTDSRIKSLEKKLNAILKFKSYRLISKESIKAKIKENKLLSLPGKGSLLLKPVIYEKNYLALKIETKGERSFSGVVKLSRNSGVIIRGPTTNEGDILLYIILAEV